MADETYRNDPNYRDPNWTDNPTAHDDVQHGIDDNPTGDAEKGAALGGIGGAVTGAVAGAVAGPGGAVLGAVIGGVAGAVASGAAVGAVDRVDNDNTVSGLGHGSTPERDTTVDTYNDTTDSYANSDEPALRKSWDRDASETYTTDVDDMPGNNIPGIQTGGHAVDGTQDTRGIWEKAEDTATGDKYDDKTGKRVA